MRTAAEMTSGMRVVEAGFMAVGAAAALALGVATAEAAKFEKQIKLVQAVSNDMTSQQVTQMGNQIKALSIKYGEAPAATAEAMQTLGRAGVKDASAQMAIFESAMKMAKIEGMGLADALDAVVKTTALFGSNMEDASQFAKDAAKMTEYMVHASQISPTDVADIQQGLTYVGGAAKEVGWSPQETMSAIAYMAQKGVSGSIAGTSIRGLLTKSVGDQPKYQAAAARLGLDPGFAWTKNEKGEEVARPLWEIVAMVRNAAATRGLGEREQFELWNAIGMQKTAQQMLKVDPEELKKFDAEMEKSFDLQKKVDTAMESVSVKFDKFKAAVSVLAINIGEKLLPVVGWIVDGLASFAGWIAQSTILTTGLAYALGGAVIIGAAVVLRWLSVAARWVWQEFTRIMGTSGGLTGYLTGLMGATEGAAVAQNSLATSTERANIALAQQRAIQTGTLLPGGTMVPYTPVVPDYKKGSGSKLPPPMYPTSMKGGLKNMGSGLMSMIGGPAGVAVLAALSVGFIASAIQDTKNVATHNETAMKNAEKLVEGYTNKESKLTDEKARLVEEQKKYNKESAEWQDLQRRITAKEGELAYVTEKKTKAQEQIAQNNEEIARWSEIAAQKYNDMLITMSTPIIPAPGVTAPTIAPDEETPTPEGITSISTRPYKTQAAVWGNFVNDAAKRQEWVETSNDPMARFYRSGMGQQYNQQILESQQKEKEIWLRTMGIDPATGEPYKPGEYGFFDWAQDYAKLGWQKTVTSGWAADARYKADEYNLETGEKKKSWWESLFGTDENQSMREANTTMNKTQSMFDNKSGNITSIWGDATGTMNAATVLFKNKTTENMDGSALTTQEKATAMKGSLESIIPSIQNTINWFMQLWGAAKAGDPSIGGGMYQEANKNASNVFADRSGGSVVAVPWSSSSVTQPQKPSMIRQTPTSTSSSGTSAKINSPVKIWRGGVQKNLAKADSITFPDLDPDLFKKRALETGEAMRGGRGGITINKLEVNAKTKADAQAIANVIRKELKKLAEVA
jgi:TP901 family phage tail tape measure protein